MSLPVNPETPRLRRPLWVPALLVLYGMLTVGLFFSPLLLVFGNSEPNFAPLLFSVIWMFVLAGLLFVPIQMRRRRPLTRGSIWLPLLVTGLLAGLTAFAGSLGLMELFKVKDVDPVLLLLLLGALGVWALWAGLFFLMGRKQGHTRVGLTLHRWLLAGSLLELLIAVPSHIVVRRRHECCAGIYTGTAICVGVLVAILALGPGILLLYYRRWKQIQIPPPPADRGFEVELASPDQKAIIHP